MTSPSDGTTMVFSHPTAEQDDARTKERHDSDGAARDVAFSAPDPTAPR
jgi:hypothetical protein